MLEPCHDINSLQRLFVAKRIPAAGSINLTDRCNLRCVHCYLGDRHAARRNFQDELSTEQWFAIIEQITAAGCLYLLLTGGEVLLRPDFAAIYQKAVESGLLVTVFTNGTLLSSDLYDVFVDLPPQSIEISLYGATGETYEAVTGVKGSFQQCLKGIQGLRENRIRFSLKTMILTQNRHEIRAMEELARGFGVDFRLDPAVSACLDGNKYPLDFRVNAAEAVALEFAVSGRTDKWRQYDKKRKGSPAADVDTLYTCGAGLTNFHIDPAGTLTPCMMLSRPGFDLTCGRFAVGWEKVLIKLRQVRAGADYACNTCDLRHLCSGCPALFALENNAPDRCSQYLCDIAKFRHQAIKSQLQLEDCRLT